MAFLFHYYVGILNSIPYSPDVCVMVGHQRLPCSDISEFENPVLTAVCEVPADLYYSHPVTISAKKWCNVTYDVVYTFRLSWGNHTVPEHSFLHHSRTK